MFKVWNGYENRWDPVDEAGAAACRARGQRVIERPDQPEVHDFSDPAEQDLSAPANLADEFDTSDAQEDASGDGTRPPVTPASDENEALAASREATTAPLPVITDAELAAPIGGGGASAIVAEFASSNVRRAALDPGTGIVTVSFANGTTYRYANFTAELLAAWQEAKSAGSWFHANVRSRADRHPVVTDGPTDG